MTNEEYNKLQEERRTAENECSKCYYAPMWSGQAFTMFTCKNCKKEYSYHNTGTPTYCNDCAKSKKICRRCGVALVNKE